MATFALMVGIDRYLGPVPTLRGCVADVQAMSDLISARLPDVQLLSLTDEQATSAAVMAAFSQHLGRAGTGDTVIFWYAGHGSQARTSSPPGVEPDGLDETLVLHDSRTDGHRDLVDKELGAMIAGVAAGGARVFVGLDCCHSGSGTRELLPPDMLVRRAPTDLRVREQGAVARPEIAPMPDGMPPDPGTDRTGWALSGPHVLLAACRSDQTAKEISIAGRSRGVLTASVERALRDSSTVRTYRDLLRTVRVAVAGSGVPDQTPQLETIDVSDLAEIFGGAMVAGDPHFRLSFDPVSSQWTLDAGALAGLPPASDSSASGIELAVFAPDGHPDNDQPLATGRVSAVFPERSTVTVVGALDRQVVYLVTITDWPLSRTAVQILGTDEAAGGGERTDDLRTALQASPYLIPGDTGDLTLADRPGGWVLIDHRRTEDPIARFPVDADPMLLVRAAEQVDRWRHLAVLTNPGSSIGAADIDFRVVRPTVAVGVAQESDGSPARDLVLPYVGGEPPLVSFSVRNTGSRTLWFALVDLNEDYAINSSILPHTVARLGPGQLATTPTFPLVVPDTLWANGVVRRTDVIQLLVSTTEFDPRVSDQGGLTRPEIGEVARSQDRGWVDVAPAPSLQRRLSRVQNRDLGAPLDGPVSDWTAVPIRLVAERGQPARPLGTGPVLIAPGVTLTVPAGVSGTVATASSVVVDRDAVTTLVPPLLLDDPDSWEALSLHTTRSDAPLDVLEFSDLAGADLVDADHPLLLTLGSPIGDDESVLVFGFDGENYIPVGRTARDRGADVVRIDTLPPAITTRSLGSSVRLLFRRFVHKLQGQSGDETRLAIATVDPVSGEAVYDDDPSAIRRRAVAADHVLVLVHGILGDTRGMVQALAAEAGPARAAGFDLVLAYDYENINTPVKHTAEVLARGLRDAGLVDPPHATVDLLAHSMGGLVSRWLIEAIDDPVAVRRLITAGTPNNGSPWPRVENWAIVGLSFALNQLGQMFWPATVLGRIVKLTESVDGALDDMTPDSAALQDLAGAADPHVPYRVLIGNRALAVTPRPDGQVQRLLRSLKRTTIDVATSMAFLGQVNDLAVSLTSALSLPVGRDPQPQPVTGIGCDHVTYFSSAAGLAAVVAALHEPVP